MAQKNASHFLNPEVGDDKLSIFKRNTKQDSKGRPQNAGSGYRSLHSQAISEAISSSQSSKPIDEALAAEAFGAHYLTDAFASGHARAERTSIRAYWDKRVPMFSYNMKGWIAEQLARDPGLSDGYTEAARRRHVASNSRPRQQGGCRRDCRVALPRVGRAARQTGDVTTGLSVGAFDGHIARLDVQIGSSLSLSAGGGFQLAYALAPFESNVGPGGGSSQSFSDPVVAPAAWMSARIDAGDLDISAGAGSFTRISPDAYAVDFGGRAELEGSLAIAAYDRDLSLSLGVDAARVRRVDVSDMAPAEVAPVGTELWLGRVAASLTVPIDSRLALGVELWTEHSDRDDPHRRAIAATGIDTSFGVELKATMALQRPARTDSSASD